MWKTIEEACEWDHPRTPLDRLLWDGRATEAVLEFLRTTRVGCIGTERAPPEDEEVEDNEGEEEGLAHPGLHLVSFVFPLFLFSFGARNQIRFPSFLYFSFLYPLRCWGALL